MLGRLLREWWGRRRGGGPVATARLLEQGQQAENQGRFEQALACYESGLAGFPDSAELFTKIGNLRRLLGRQNAAIAAYRAAVVLKPDFAPARNNLGVALCANGQADEAATCFRKAIATDPELVAAYENLGGILFGKGDFAASLDCFQRVVAAQPDNGYALHMAATLAGANPERAPEQYVAKIFDDYADGFDAHLTLGLQYDTPQHLASLINEYVRPGLARWDALDLGCGTGLLGAQIADRARQLVGVDLSGRMLEKARAKGFYTRLAAADLLAMMRAEASASYDVIGAADVFTYNGRLDDIVAEARRLLRAGGILAFSAEALAAAEMPGAAPVVDYRLAPSGRYAHASSYLTRLALTQDFIPRCLVSSPIRQERGVPVPGWLVIWERPEPMSGGH